MPSEHILTIHDGDQPDSQVKICSACRGPVLPGFGYTLAAPTLLQHVLDDAVVCAQCHGNICLREIEVDEARELRETADLHPVTELGRREEPGVDDAPCRTSAPPSHTQAPPMADKPPRLTIDCTQSASASTITQQRSLSSPSPSSSTSTPAPDPEPLIDITHMRIRSHRHPCLYPGSTFTGVQKSERNSYEVTVSIIDVDFKSSFLCGRLAIAGLTDDWPELTTYFDAEIIGPRHGFITQPARSHFQTQRDSWGASPEDDMTHWARFPEFRNVQNELQGSHLTLPDKDGVDVGGRSAVFMRWKERFLVPDHRVKDISGASFAGSLTPPCSVILHPPFD